MTDDAAALALRVEALELAFAGLLGAIGGAGAGTPQAAAEQTAIFAYPIFSAVPGEQLALREAVARLCCRAEGVARLIAAAAGEGSKPS